MKDESHPCAARGCKNIVPDKRRWCAVHRHERPCDKEGCAKMVYGPLRVCCEEHSRERKNQQTRKWCDTNKESHLAYMRHHSAHVRDAKRLEVCNERSEIIRGAYSPYDLQHLSTAKFYRACAAILQQRVEFACSALRFHRGEDTWKSSCA